MSQPRPRQSPGPPASSLSLISTCLPYLPYVSLRLPHPFVLQHPFLQSLILPACRVATENIYHWLTYSYFVPLQPKVGFCLSKKISQVAGLTTTVTDLNRFLVRTCNIVILKLITLQRNHAVRVCSIHPRLSIRLLRNHAIKASTLDCPCTLFYICLCEMGGSRI